MIWFVNRKMQEKSPQKCEIQIKHQGKEIRVKALIDSGNLLKDPISQLPVIIVEKEKLKELVDSYFLENMDVILKGEWLVENNTAKPQQNFVLIPFRSLGNDHGLLIGFKPDKIELQIENRYFKKEAIIGIYPGRLSGKKEEYQAIVGL